MTTIDQMAEGIGQIRPIQMLTVGNRAQVPAPFIRVTCCGLLTIEVVAEVMSADPPLARYISLTPDQLRGRGVAPALQLLKLLVNQPQRFALKDWLIEQFCSDREVYSSSRLENIVWQLRSMLCPPAYEDLRAHVVSLVRGSASSGNGYQLASYPFIWADVDAVIWHAEQAARMERFGDDPLPFWERAYALAKRGMYLPDELYSDWATARRGEVAGMLRQSVQALARLYLARHGEAGEEESLLLLRSYWQEHPREEDILRPLMELLGRRECYQEGLEYFARLEKIVAEEGLEPDQRTRDLAAYLRTKQIQRQYNEQHFVSLPSVLQTSEIVQGKVEITLEEEPEARSLPAAEKALQAVQIETRHLIGREAWVADIVQMVQASLPKKLIVLQGPVGVGKSSELHRLADAFRRSDHAPSTVIWLSLPAAEWDGSPDTALDVLLGTFLAECGLASLLADLPREKRLSSLFTHLEQQQSQTVVLLDNAECMLNEKGQFAPCWESFLVQFVRRLHQTTLILATKEWHGWPGREGVFVAETFVPPLTLSESTALLQRLGLDAVPVEHLRTISERMAGIPLLLEWTAKLIHDPLLFDDWQSFADYGEGQHHPDSDDLTSRLARLLEDPALLGAHLAHRLTPLLQHIIEKHLSTEARKVLERLAVTPIPLGKPALQVLCPRPALVKELRDASLLAGYTNRVQLLPVVASTVYQQLSSEQREEMEGLVIQAYTRWLDEGNLEMREAGIVVTELAVLLLTYNRLLDAAELLLNQGWISLNYGYGPRLAQLTQQVLSRIPWHDSSIEQECAVLVFVQTVFPFLGRPFEAHKHVDYKRIRDAFLTGGMALSPMVECDIAHVLLLDAMTDLRFEDAQAIVDSYRSRLAHQIPHPEQHISLLQEQALLAGTWCEYLEELGEKQQSFDMRQQAIDLYRQCATHFLQRNKPSSLREFLNKRGLAYNLAHLGYHLSRLRFFEEALRVIDTAITLREQGYGYLGSLAMSYSDKSQILLELGRFQEALLFDEKAMQEIQRCVSTGDGLSQEDVWVYQVNRGQIYLRLGKIREAEFLLQEALPHISAHRRMYRMFAKDALNEIAQWRSQTTLPHHQLDWRWVEKFRKLSSYDSRWWLTWAGPFTSEEQTQWDSLITCPLDESIKAQLGLLLKVSRERELAAAIEDQREPQLYYPAIDIQEISRRIQEQKELAAEIEQGEPNTIVRRLYQGAIAEEIDYLSLIEATYEHDSEQFWECSRRLFPLPTLENMEEAFTYIKQVIQQGLAKPETAMTSQQIQKFLQTLFPENFSRVERTHHGPMALASSALDERMISAVAAQRFFLAILRESGYSGWQVVLDSNTSSARVEQAARYVFLPDKQFLLSEIKHLFVHELAGHVARCVAGERSALGLLGIHTRNSLPTEEGLALYHELQVLALHGQKFDDSWMQLSTFLLSLASGVGVPAQTFYSLYTFLQAFTLLTYQLSYPEADSQTTQQYARAYALDICLRVYRGVPDLTRPGVCYLQDTVHLYGLRMIEKAVTEDAQVLDRLAVGVCALEDLPDLYELGITSVAQPLKKLAYTVDLDDYILSFEEQRADDN